MSTDTQLASIEEKVDAMSQVLDDLIREVSETKTAIASAIVLIQGLKAQLDAAGTDEAKLAELSAELNAQQYVLANALLAGTPADPGTTGAIRQEFVVR